MVQVTIKPSNKKDVIYIIDDAIKRKRSMLKIAIQQTQRILRIFEKKFKMKTNVFYAKFISGKIGDKTEYIEWAGEKELIDRLKKEYKQIQEIHFVY